MIASIKMSWEKRVRNPALMVASLKFGALALLGLFLNPDEVAFAGEVVVHHANALDVHSVTPVAVGEVWGGGMYEVSCTDGSNVHAFVDNNSNEPSKAWAENAAFYQEGLTLKELADIVGKGCSHTDTTPVS